METLKKIYKSKSLKEALLNIPIGFFEIVAFLMLMLFMTKPVLIFIDEQTPIYISTVLWRHVNYWVCFIGIAVLLLYVLRIKAEGKFYGFRKLFNNNYALVLFGVFFLLMVISTVKNGITELALFGSEYRREGFIGYTSYLVYFLLAGIISSKRLKMLWIYIFSTSAAILAIFPMFDFNSAPEDYIFTSDIFNTFLFFQYNHYGYYLLVAIVTSAMLFITEKKLWVKLIFAAEYVILIVGLIMNDTFGCVLALIVGVLFICIVYSIAKGKFKAITLVPIALMIITGTCCYFASDTIAETMQNNYYQMFNDTEALLNGKDEADMSTGVTRIILWENTMNYLAEQPLLGFSADATGERLLADTNDTDRCHCEFLNYAVCFGVPASVFYIAAVLTIYLRGLINKKKLTELNLIGLCVAFAYLASSIVGNSMFYTAPYLFIMLGFGYFRNRDTQQEVEETN